MNYLKLSLLVLVLAPTPAFASLKFGCANVEDLKSSAESCEDNAMFADAGSECIEKLEALISSMTKVTTAQLQANAAAASSKQTGTQIGAEKGYNVSGTTLDLLLAAAKIAKRQVGGFHDNIAFPDDASADEEIIGDPMDFLDNEPCYADSRDILEDVEDDIDYYIEDLEKAKAAVATLEGASDTREKKLDAGTPGAADVKSNSAPRRTKKGVVPKGIDPRESDISGTEPPKK